MVKFAIKHYNIPTKKDVEKLMARMDRLEKLIKQTAKPAKAAPAAAPKKVVKARKPRAKSKSAAMDSVIHAVSGAKNGMSVTDIQSVTGFDPKKIRNIIYRLNKLGKIKRARRGVYVAT
ncbi:MAG: hypothetical protein GY859_35500 [Desulfobacterales bacterium]|nr:hypothetical protein [Desulfobacterales bacterium]